MSQNKPKVIEKKVRVIRKYPDDLQSHIVDNLVVQHQPDRFVLSFFEVWLPAMLAESDEEFQGQVDSLESVEAKCVARLVVTPQRMREFVNAMTKNLENYDRMTRQLSKESE